MAVKTIISVTQGANKKEYNLDKFKKDTIVIGRSQDCDIVVHNERVSGHHGLFYKENGLWNYQDLNSTNGTVLNSKKITKAGITEGDIFLLGSTVKEDSVFVYIESIGVSDSIGKEKKRNIDDKSGVGDKKYNGLIIGLVVAIIVAIIAIILVLLLRKDDSSSGGGATGSVGSKHGKIDISIDKSVLTYDETFDKYCIPEEFDGFSGTIEGNESDLKEIQFCITDSNNVEVAFGQAEHSDGIWKIDKPGMMIGENTLKVTAVNMDDVEGCDEITFYNNEEEYLDEISIDTEDKDDDGLIGYIETSIGTDDNNPDTDGDGLMDSIEYAYTQTSPVKYDSEGDGICDADRDSDNDGLTNKTEIDLGTDPGVDDTDCDGLIDGEEVNSYKTDPLNDDTDADEAGDLWEVENGTDPLIKDEAFKVDISYEAEDSDVSAKAIAEFSGNPESIIIEPVVNNALFDSSMSGYIGYAYNVNFPDEGNDCNISLNMTFDSAKSYDSDDIAIYEYDEEEQLLEEIETIVSGNTATATINHAATYILLDKTEVNSVISSEIMTQDEIDTMVIKTAFVIDYSQSMDDNDPDYSRLRIVKEYLNRMDNGRNKACIIKFARQAVDLTGGMNGDINYCEEMIGNIINNSGGGGCESDNEAGTDGSAGLNEAINVIEKDDNPDDANAIRSIIFLTDGQDNYFAYDYDEIIATAKADGIVIYTIGLGNADEELLMKIADETGGKYYKASEIDEDMDGFYTLEESFSDIQQHNEEINNDTNGDGIKDYYTRLICEGKLRTGTGVNPYEGLSFEDVNQSADLDGDGLKNGEEIEVYEKDDIIYLKYYSSPVDADTDGDGYTDNVDNRKLLWDVGNRDLAIFSSLSYCDAIDEGKNKGFIGGMYTEKDISDNELKGSFYIYSSLYSKECIDTNKYDDSGIWNNWIIVDYVNEANSFGLDYFSMTVYKCQDNIVLAYRGTGSTDEELGEWIENLIGYGLFKYHTEEEKAKKYARKVARLYPDCKIYITGHSLGGYLAQIGAAAMLNDTSVKPERVVYFDGMGLDFTFFGKIGEWVNNTNPVNRLSKLLHLDEKIALMDYYNNKENEDEANLVLFYVYGDPVSALGNHYGYSMGFEASADYANYLREQNKDEGNKILTEVTAGVYSVLSMKNVKKYYDKYNKEYGTTGIGEFMVLTHNRPSFYEKIKQGRRGD